MTKAQLLADMAVFYTSVDTSRFIDTSKNVNWYIVKVLMTGLSGPNKKPTAFVKTISFYVYNEGTAEESADYGEKELINESDSDITSDGSLDSISKIYRCTFMQNRVQASVAKTAQSILDESLYTAYLASDAGMSQKIVVIATGTGSNFWVDKVVIISDTSGTEQNTIASVDGDTLTMVNNLSNQYKTSKQAKVTYKDNIERLKWAASALMDTESYINAMLKFVSLNGAVQAAGGLATDNDIDYVVSNNVNVLAVVIDS